MSLHWTAVADALNARMRERGVSQAELSRKSGIHADTIRKVQGAASEGYRAGTLYALSRALGWPADTLDRIADGEDPFSEVQAPAAASGVTGPVDDALLRRLDEMEETLRRMEEMMRREGGPDGDARRR